jgi:hypothetical protein
MRKFKAKVFLSHGKGGKDIYEPRREKLKPEDEVTKTGPSGLGF